jgi:hypothetical protein
MLQAVACGPLLPALVSLMADPMEKVRELNYTLLRRLLEVVPDPDALLPAVIPAVHRRFGALPVEEPSEELRREIAELLSGVLAERTAPTLIKDYKVWNLGSSSQYLHAGSELMAIGPLGGPAAQYYECWCARHFTGA